MKKKFLLLPLAAGFAFISLSSYSSGAGASGFNATGAETGSSTNTGCTSGGCHSAGASVNVTIVLDSAGVAVTHYKAGLVYTVKIRGVNNTTLTLPKYGLQLTSIRGTSPSGTPTNVGSWATSLADSLRYTAGSGGIDCNVVEHRRAITATSGTGGTGTVYEQSFQWTAPASSGSGTISFWGVVNAVNGNGNTSGDAFNTANITVQEWAVPTGVDNVVAGLGVKAFPVPFTNVLNLDLGSATGTTNVTVSDMSGRIIALQTLNSNTASINTGSWAQGIYAVTIENEGRREVISVVK